MRRLTLSFCLLVAVVAAACGKSETPGTLVPKSAPNKPCSDQLPFTVGYLPAGFSRQLQPGPEPGKPPIKNVTIFHLMAPGGKYIEILRGGKRGILNGSVGIIVMNRTGSIGPTTGGNAINFRLGSSRCARYQVFSNDRDPQAKELVKIGHGLQALR